MRFNNKKLELPILSLSIFIFYTIIPPVHLNMVKNLAELCVELDPTEIFFQGKIESKPSTNNPFFIKSNFTEVHIGESVSLTLTSKELHKFKGFMIQPRYSNNLLVGTFQNKSNAVLYDCLQQGLNIPTIDLEMFLEPEDFNKRNLLVYDGNELIDSYTVVYNAPDYIIGFVRFYFTVYVDAHTYWKNETTKDSYINIFYKPPKRTRKPKERIIL